MFAAVPSGAVPAALSPAADAVAEPLLIESVLTEIQELLARSRELGTRVTAEAGARSGATEWRQLDCEVTAAHERAERSLRLAAANDGVSLPRDAAGHAGHAGARAAAAPAAGESVVRHCRRLARELEELCASVVPQADALGLDHLAFALGRWRCDLIGLEQPLITAQAHLNASRKR